MRAYRVPAAAVLLMLVAGCQAFVMPPSQRTSAVPTTGAPTTTARAAFGMVDSFHLMDALASSASATFSSISLADALESVDVDAATTAAAAATSSADAAAEASSNPGWFGFLTGPIEGLLQIIHSVLVTVGVSSDAWGVSIIMMTVIIKILTFPLTKTQLESTNKMQMIQPAVKDLQAKYQSNPEVMNQKIAELYQTNEINPLAGCLPSLVQIPVFIGLYRAVLELAKDNKLDEPFLWLPNLEGPTYGADPTHGSDWILTGWVDGAPSLGWGDTLAFLSLPLFLVVSQFVSMQLMQPKSDDPAQQQSNLILKLLPLMIGWFSLNVPAALCIYWVTNNIITTATSLLIKNTMKAAPVSVGSSSRSAVEPPPSIFAPPREKPAGFGGGASFSSSSSPPEPKAVATPSSPPPPPKAAAVDAEIVVTPPDEAETVAAEEAVPPASGVAPSAEEAKTKKSGKNRRKKRKN